MCGFVQLDTDNEYIPEVLSAIGCESVGESFPKGQGLRNYYPAFGGYWHRSFEHLIIQDNPDTPRTVNATWWFDCQAQGEELIVNDRVTFNARNLDSPFWKGALNHKRALVLATAIGESQRVGKTKHQYLMRSEKPFLLGALYRQFDNQLYSCAVITRDPHPRLKQFHEKSTAFFLPIDKKIIQTWLYGPLDETLQQALQQAALPVSLEVGRVKSFKSGLWMGQTQIIPNDETL